MKKKALCILVLCSIFALLFPEYWKNAVLLRLFPLLESLSDRIVFPLVEALGLLLTSILWLGFVRRLLQGRPLHALFFLLKRTLCLLLGVLLLFLCLWFPLYLQAPLPIKPASAAHLKASADELVQSLNKSDLDFSLLPDDLPAKFTHFPALMEAFGAVGFYSFFTGEALLSPHLPACAVPFVAVHERVHGLGIADEGRCNRIAYEKCLRLGSVYADSAMLWALRYTLGALQEADFALYTDSLHGMNRRTQHCFAQIGGAYAGDSGSKLLRTLLGYDPFHYEILAHALAAEINGCYNTVKPSESK